MTNYIKIPKDGASDNDVEIVSKSKKNGQWVHQNEEILQYQTSKAIFELVTDYEGYIYFLKNVGDRVSINHPVCIISKEKLSKSNINDSKKELGYLNDKSKTKKLITKKAALIIEKNSIDVDLLNSDFITESIVTSYLKKNKTLNNKSLKGLSFKGNDILLYGIGGHARQCRDILTKNNKYHLSGFIDDFNDKDIKNSLRYFGGSENLEYLIKIGLENLILGLGLLNDLKKREKIYNKIKQKINIPTIIHPSAIIEESAIIEDGCQIMAGAIIGPDVIIKENCIINSGAIISHDTEIGSSSHVTPGATIAGDVTIGKRVTIGMCATLFYGISIKNDTVVNNNQSVIRSV
tara:strand:+ start:1714 stop:2760 length:1047 start_codon:yes stop_codon:yes gene_type:complete